VPYFAKIVTLHRSGGGMTMKHWMALMLALMLGVADVRAQPAPGVEAASYAKALAIKEPVKRAEALEVFIAWYPGSAQRIEAFEQTMAAWQSANNPEKADAAAARLLQIDPDNVRALANRAYVGRTRAMAGDAAALAPAVTAAERGLAVLPKAPRPAALGEGDFLRQKMQMIAVFDGTLGFAALQAKQYDKARERYLKAVATDPDNLADVYQLSVSQLELQPCDALGFWYAARAIAIARVSRNETAAAGIDKYARAHYQRYHGSDQGWVDIVARAAAGPKQPPEQFARSISRVMTPAEAALQSVADTEPAAMSFSEWALVLAQRDESDANRIAAERVWKAVGDKQKGGARLKIPIKVLSVTSDRIEGAISDRSRASNTADLVVSLARPLTPLPPAGAVISVVGTLSDYQPRPFFFRMSKGELADESLPIAGGVCADPRPQMCTRDYRPACGVRRDGTRRTYGNACTACADAEVVSQGAGPCP
jgi:tetratricopeptide (TPR) repeat protein